MMLSQRLTADPLRRTVQPAQRSRATTALRAPVVPRCQATAGRPDGPESAQCAPEASTSTGPTLKRRQLISLAGATAAVSMCPCCVGTAPAAAREISPGGAPAAWEYGQLEGPKNWGGMCAAGINQSPVDLPMMWAKPAQTTLELSPLDFEYNAKTPSTVFNTGHGTMQVNVASGKYIANLGGRRCELLQFHFHAPSEHTFDGVHAPMEVHLVHRDVETGGLAVVGVLLGRGQAPNPALQWALTYAPRTSGPYAQPKSMVDIAGLLPPARTGRRNYIHYTGSLTTPPCSEEVQWFVCTDLVSITDQQILDFSLYAGGGKALQMNARPVQPLGERELQYFL